MYMLRYGITSNKRRSPQGERGLKYAVAQERGELAPSLPARGAWIEMFYVAFRFGGLRRSPQGERGLK